MSIEVYLQFWEHGECAWVSAERVRAALGAVLPVGYEITTDVFRLDPGAGDERYTCETQLTRNEKGDVTAMCVFRPTDHPRLWQALFAMLQLGHATVFWPDAIVTTVTSDASIPHVPVDFVESFGPLKVATHWTDILEVEPLEDEEASPRSSTP
jgi:hypothetical protein